MHLASNIKWQITSYERNGTTKSRKRTLKEKENLQ